MQTLRTPDDRFVDLPDFDFAPHYVEVADGDDGRLRVHHLDEGPPDGEVVLLMHGEPSWCFLYRHVIPVLVDAGLRCVAPDLVGLRPLRQADRAVRLHLRPPRRVDARRPPRPLDLRDVTLVGQDWGGLVGLRLAAENPDRFARIVVGQHRPPDR